MLTRDARLERLRPCAWRVSGCFYDLISVGIPNRRNGGRSRRPLPVDLNGHLIVHSAERRCQVSTTARFSHADRREQMTYWQAWMACGLLMILPAAAQADIFRWDNGQLIPGTEGIMPGPGV